jgi:hypothetical protein
LHHFFFAAAFFFAGAFFFAAFFFAAMSIPCLLAVSRKSIGRISRAAT